MKKYHGSIMKRGNYYHWKYRNAQGKITTKAVRNATGGRVVNYIEAEKIVTQWSADLFSLHQLKSKEETIQKIAQIKSLLAVCRTPLSELEDAFFEHPSAPTISIKHRKTYHSVLTSLAIFAEQMQAKTVADVTEDVAQAFLSFYWNKGIAPKTYNSVLNVLSCVFRLMNKDSNPFDGFKKKTCQTEERAAFTVGQLQKIWETLNAPQYHMMHKDEMIVLYKLALYTGARCGDLCLLRWSSVDMQNRVIRFVPHKTAMTSHKAVEIPIGDVLYAALLPLNRTTEYVLPNVAARYSHNSGGISRDTKKLLVAAGLSPTDEGTSRRVKAVSRMGMHSFRHTAASLLIANGVNPLVVRDILGHASVEMTAHYSHISLESKQKAVLALEDAAPSSAQGKGNVLGERILMLSRAKLAVIGQWLEGNLSQTQKTQLQALLIK